MNTIMKYVLGALVLACLCLAIGMAYQHSKISSQGATIASQAETIGHYEQDKAAQEVADSQLQAEKEQIAAQRNKYKKQLNDALANQECAAAPLPNDAKRVLQELYSRKGS